MGEKALRVGQHSLGHTPSCGYGERRGEYERGGRGNVRGEGGRMGGGEGRRMGEEEGRETGGQLEDGRERGRIQHCLHVQILWILYFKSFTQLLL